MAMDLTCTPHLRHIGISSMVLRAVAAHRPVLAVNEGWFAALIPRLGLGWTCSVTDSTDFANSMARCLDAAPKYRPSEAARRLLAFHCVENFQGVWTKRLRDRVGAPPASQMISWDWVLEATDALSGRPEQSPRDGYG